jgi:hypoxanthine phosphoribosyltransferase
MHERYNRLATAAEVDQEIVRIAGEILRDEPDPSPLFVALLRGAAPFSSKLMFELARQSPDFHPEIDYMMVSTYGGERHASEPHIVTDLAPSTTVNGRDVIIIDDVLDKGITADFVTKHLQARGAADVKLAVLCDKRTARERDTSADYCGFTFDDNWLVGMGMDDAEAADEGYRWLGEIWEIKRS